MSLPSVAVHSCVGVSEVFGNIWILRILIMCYEIIAGVCVTGCQCVFG